MWTQQCRRALSGRGWEVREPLRAEGWKCRGLAGSMGMGMGGCWAR